jgi:hypothetical protein
MVRACISPIRAAVEGGVLPQYSDRARAQHLGTQVKVLHGERTSRRGPDDKQTSLNEPVQRSDVEV